MSGIPASVQLEHAGCPLCGDVPATPVVHGSDLLHDLPGTFTVACCTSCGLLRTDPRPTPATIGFYYPADYGPYLGTVVSGPAEGGGWKARLVAMGKRLFDTKVHAIPDRAPGRMLELGCASGSYLHTMAARGSPCLSEQASADSTSGSIGTTRSGK